MYEVRSLLRLDSTDNRKDLELVPIKLTLCLMSPARGIGKEYQKRKSQRRNPNRMRTPYLGGNYHLVTISARFHPLADDFLAFSVLAVKSNVQWMDQERWRYTYYLLAVSI